MGYHENDLSEICNNKTCLHPLYTGRCLAECLERFRKISGIKDYPDDNKKEE
jgi:hypothetical protein